jgi:hypothetical protein
MIDSAKTELAAVTPSSITKPAVTPSSITKPAVTPSSRTTPLNRPDDAPPVGSWWWLTSKDKSYKPSDYDEPGCKWLACVIEVGSNYAKVKGVRFSTRIALDDFHTRCTPEGAPDAYIATKVGFHKTCVRELMGEIQRLCHQLGVPLYQALAAAEPASQALAIVHGVTDVKQYKKSLVKAKDKTLPELFEKIKEEHKEMAKWMSAELIPMEAELKATTEVKNVIADKIHTVDLYAGLTEELVAVREGDAAPIDTKVHLMQRRHYMDEECLARYEAGGMSFEDIEAFDKWLARDENFTRLLPHDRTIVAFRVRHYDRRTDNTGIEAFIALWYENQESRRTYLYIRNGRQLWRMETSINFEEELFPSREDSELLGDEELWIKESEYDLERSDHGGIITGRQRANMIQTHKSKRAYAAQKLQQWKRAGKPKAAWDYVAIKHEHEQYGWKPGEVHRLTGKPYAAWHHERLDDDPVGDYVLLTPTTIYYDDAMRRIKRAAFEHNRIAVIVQGLLDRSTCLHPHPPWRIWTPEGFAAGIELVYDVSRALTPGDALDWVEYRKQLNKSLRPGCYTIGQSDAWEDHMEKRYGAKWRDHIQYTNKGPGKIDCVVAVKRDGACEFRWTRSRAKAKWVRNPERPGYLKATYPRIATGWICPADKLTCVDAYTPGDFHLFFDDPRTRADYLKWAPILLACEDWHQLRKMGKIKEDGDEDEEAD